MTISHSDLAHDFANGATKGESSNMFIDKDTIYSYGSHFPIAKRIPGGYIVNSDKYSVTTSSHQSTVWSAIYPHILWEAPGCEEDLTVNHYASEVEAILVKIPKSRRFFSYYLKRLQKNLQKAQVAAKEFKLNIQPLYNAMDSKAARAAIARIRKEDKVFPGLLEAFGKSQFFKGKELKATFFKPEAGKQYTVTLVP